jgi:hypothetical protein
VLPELSLCFIEQFFNPCARYAGGNSPSARTSIGCARAVRNEQSDNLRLLLARCGAATATATSRLNGEMQRRRSAPVGWTWVRPMLEENARGRSAACANGAMQRADTVTIDGIRIRSGFEQALNGRRLSNRIPAG